MTLHKNNLAEHILYNGYSQDAQDYLKSKRFKSEYLSLLDSIIEHLVKDAEGNGLEILMEIDNSESIPGHPIHAIHKAWDAMLDYLDGNGAGQLSIVNYENTNEFKVDIEWFGREGISVYDRVFFELSDPFPLLLNLHPNEMPFTYTAGKKPKPFSPCKLFQYHPERYKQSRHFFSEQQEKLASIIDMNRGGLKNESAVSKFQEVMTATYTEMNERGSRFPIKGRDDSRGATFIMDSELSLMQNMSRFYTCGRQIMDINPDLVTMFKHTDVNDIPVNLIRLPYTTQY